jgi:hypothetical protein
MPVSVRHWVITGPIYDEVQKNVTGSQKAMFAAEGKIGSVSYYTGEIGGDHGRRVDLCPGAE